MSAAVRADARRERRVRADADRTGRPQEGQPPRVPTRERPSPEGGGRRACRRGAESDGAESVGAESDVARREPTRPLTGRDGRKEGR